MKSILSIVCALVCTLTTTAELRITSPVSNQIFRQGEKVQISWTHHDGHAGREVRLTISAFPEEQQSLSDWVRVTEELLTVPVMLSNTESSFPWTIPGDLRPGRYKITITEQIPGSITDLAINRVWVEVRAPLVKLASRRVGPVRIGSTPDFRYTVASEHWAKVTPYLRKNGAIVGILVSSSSSAASGTWRLDWSFTQYSGTNATLLFPKAGDGYTIFVGIRKNNPVAGPERFKLEDFVAYDESEPFTLSPPQAAVFIKPAAGIRDEISMYVFTVPGQLYRIAHSPVMPPVWGRPSEFLATEDVTTVTAHQVGPQQGFFRLEELASGPTLARHGTGSGVTFTVGKAVPNQ